MKVGVIGYGSIGSRHVTNLLALGHEVMVYDPAAKDMLASQRNEDSIYEACEAVVIASPTVFHEHALRRCVKRGKHVLVEKPIGLQIGALPELLDLAQADGLTVMMGNNLRFHPCVQQAKIWLAQGKLGEALWANFICATSAEKYTGDSVILNTGAHEVDLARYLFGHGICVAAHGDTRWASFVIEHDGGVRSSFLLDLETPNRVREFWIAGTEQNLGVDLDNRNLVLGGTMTNAPGSYDDDYRNEMAGFIDRINGVFAPGAAGYDGLATLRTLLDVKRKAGQI